MLVFDDAHARETGFELLLDGFGHDSGGDGILLAAYLGADAVAVELEVDATLEVHFILHKAGSLFANDLFDLNTVEVLLDELLRRGREVVDGNSRFLCDGCVGTADEKTG